MRNIPLIEKDDLQKIDNKLSYFLFSEHGFLKGIATYAYNISLKEEIEATDRILAATEEDLKKMNAHVADRIEYSKKTLKEANQRIISAIETLDKFNRIKALLDKQPTFQDAINALINDKEE